MRTISSVIIFLAVAGIIPSALQLMSETAIAQEVTAKKKEATVYTVQGGNKVDAKTLEGWRTWRAMACDRCHGAQQEGLTGPPLIDSLKRMNMEDFKKAVLEGRPDKGMPNYNTTKLVADNIDNLYAYLKGRSDDAIQPGRLQPITQ
ncbi:MAG TPA: cytochrome c [Burkholderiales bacterium]|nr:cytochrome c [Burkholderiales bacterium]